MKIAIAGYGVEGKSNYEYFKTRGDITIVDERQDLPDSPDGVPTILGAGAFEKLSGFDLVVRTAGLAPRKIKTNGKIWSATNEFFAQCKTLIIGVTGTKGKGTTSSLINNILRASDHKTVLVGNIGQPALDMLNEANQADAVVYEMSSFQLWDIEKSPHVAVVLMIEPDHLDIHTSFDDYVAAKNNITLFQTENDLIVYNATNEYSRAIGEASGAQKIACPSETSAHVVDNQFYYGAQKICSTNILRLPGSHNLDNACAAIDAVWPFTRNMPAIEAGLHAFDGLPHRLKFVRNFDGVDYYDDSIATTPGSTVAAINAFDQPKILILGGSSKGISDFSSIASAVAKGNVKAVILIGSEADVIEQLLLKTKVKIINLGPSVTMPEVVAAARQQATSGNVVILSPAYASFGMFKSYSDRGDQFIAAVNGLG
jgi:UDP-N-acetylmuramoylalanine--D-glutamate ligase